MKPQDAFELTVLAALWGGSFIFMRLGAGEFGPVALAGVRVALAALILLPLLASRGGLPALREHWRAIAFVGIVNTALPFVAFSYAALTINAGLSSVFNATAPLWGAIVAWLWLHDKLTAQRVLGLLIGFAGVSWLAWDRVGFTARAQSDHSGATVVAILACLAGTLCYGIAVNFTKRHLGAVPPLALATGSQAAAAIVLAVPAAWLWPASAPSTTAWLSVAALALFCTAFAYLLYFRLIANIGPAKSIAVTFLIPLFGVLWGALFLGERVSAVMVMAGGVVLLGTALATGVVKLRGRR